MRAMRASSRAVAALAAEEAVSAGREAVAAVGGPDGLGGGAGTV